MPATLDRLRRDLAELRALVIVTRIVFNHIVAFTKLPLVFNNIVALMCSLLFLNGLVNAPTRVVGQCDVEAALRLHVAR